MVPSKKEPDPSVAELPTCQMILQASAPLIRLIELPDAVTRLEVAWKIKTPGPLSVRVPIRLAVLANPNL